MLAKPAAIERPLPALDQGHNTITFASGAPEGTVTIEGSIQLRNKDRQLVYTDFDPQLKGIAAPTLVVQAEAGEIVFPVSTPGDLTRLRFGRHFLRALAPEAGWDYQVSFDHGATWPAAGRAAGPTRGNCHYVTFSDVPKGTREAWVRFAGTSHWNATVIYKFRIDADFREPFGGFAPVKITYRWEENGVAKEHVFVARKPDDIVAIHCAAKPVMKSLTLKRGD